MKDELPAPVDPNSLELDDFLNVRVSRLSSKMQRLGIRKLVTNEDIGIGEWRVIVRLHVNGPMNMTQVSRTLGIDPGATSRMLKSAVSGGLLQRHADPDDGRAYLFELTDRARAIYARVWPVAQQLAAEFTSLYSPEERAVLNRLLDRALEHADRLIDAEHDAIAPGHRRVTGL